MRVTLVALAVVLAGCPALGGGGTSTTTQVTPVPVPSPDAWPPGVGPEGVEDPTALAEAHTTSVENASYTLVSNRTIRGANGSLLSLLDVTIRLAADRTYHVSARTAGPAAPLLLGLPPARAEFWSNGTVYLRAVPGPDGVVVNRFSPQATAGTWQYWRSTVAFGGQDGHAYETLRGLFRAIPTEVARLEGRTESGPTRFFLRGETAVETDFAKAGTGTVEDVTLRAVVREDGLVESVDLAYVRGSGAERIRVRWRIRYEAVNETTVGGPPWPAALAQDSSTTDPSATASSMRSTSTPS